MTRGDPPDRANDLARVPQQSRKDRRVQTRMEADRASYIRQAAAPQSQKTGFFDKPRGKGTIGFSHPGGAYRRPGRSIREVAQRVFDRNM